MVAMNASMYATSLTLAGLPQLRELDMCYNMMTVPIARLIAETLPALNVLRVNGNEFGAAGIAALAAVFKGRSGFISCSI
jgi:hypothetical protein